VREEEVDWCIYRSIADGDARTRLEIIAFTRFDPSLIDVSLDRLVKAGLLIQTGDYLRVLSFQESIFQKQIQSDEDSPIHLENGVIRVKKGRET
jgi:hypothetical protein